MRHPIPSLNQHTSAPSPKPVDPGREELATRVKTPDTRQADLTHPHHGFDTTSSPSEQTGSTNFHLPKPVEPGREKRTPRAPDTRQADLTHPHHGFDTTSSPSEQAGSTNFRKRNTGRLKQLREKASRVGSGNLSNPIGSGAA